MRWFVVSMCAVVASGCRDGCSGSTKSQSTSPPPSTQRRSEPPTMPGAAQMRVGSAAFHFEIAQVYERYQDSQTAIDHLSKAAALAEDFLHRAQVFSSLARLKETIGDRSGAIEGLERARAEMEKFGTAEYASGAAGAPHTLAPFGHFGAPSGVDILLRLARLYSEAGDLERAQNACKSGLLATRAPWQREQFYQLEIELLRKAGTLERKLAEAEKVLDEKTPNEFALRLLTAARAGNGMAPPLGAGVLQQEGQAVSPKLVRAYERLLEIHPDDAQVRQGLQSVLEQAGRIEEAAKLASTSPVTMPMHCPGPFSLPSSAAVARAADAVHVRIRAGQADKALAGTKQVAALARQEGIVASLIAADLYLEQGADKLAAEELQRGAANARSQDDRRQVAFARQRAFQRAGQSAELKALRDEWRASDDLCLRQAAMLVEQQSRPMGVNAMIPMPPAPDSH
jgi:tetratricopeptide (TPR) repeat protein